MVYLSRILLNAQHRRVQTLLANCQELHTFVMGGFPQIVAPTDPRQHFAVLFRIEAIQNNQQAVRLVVQARQQPDWSWIAPAMLAPAPDQRGNPAVRSVDAEYEQIQRGMTLYFRLRANPTKRVSSNNREDERTVKWHGKRIELRSDAERMHWLEKQGEQHGFRLVYRHATPSLPEVRIISQAALHGRQKFVEQGEQKGRQLTFGAAIFEGLLEVTDASMFRQALVEGIGKAKAYGFGLLSIAHVGENHERYESADVAQNAR